MSKVTFADVVHQSISFSPRDPAERLVLELLDTRWVQRLRDISQTANTRLVYMFSEHSRFGHSLGVAYLAKLLLDALSTQQPAGFDDFRPAVLAAALLHDVGHLAPGSHTAFRTWFPDQPDIHEELSAAVIANDPEIHGILARHAADLPEKVRAILAESPDIPAWTWQAVSGSGWNADRGNWCIVDSVLAGVSYGHYNIPALVDSLQVTGDGSLALAENRLDAMMHFAVSRHAMYRQIYQHRVLLAADFLSGVLVQRARDLGASNVFADATMQAALRARDARALSLDEIFEMREPWWRYHLMQWRKSSDVILADLSDRLLHRRLFKTVRILDENEASELRERARDAVTAVGFDARYYLGEISTNDVNAGDAHNPMMVRLDTGVLRTIADADPLYRALSSEYRASKRGWLVMPSEAKGRLGRPR
jgi:HD superfamily phosphohydrolase